MRNVSEKKITENENTHFIFNFFSSKILPWYRQATIGNMTQGRCDLNKNTTYTPVIFNNYCFSTATMVMRTRLSVTSYVQCLSC